MFKGNCGLFEFFEMFWVLYVVEDLMSVVCDGQVVYDCEMVDLLLEVMDFVVCQFDDIELVGQLDLVQVVFCVELVVWLCQCCGM